MILSTTGKESKFLGLSVLRGDLWYKHAPSQSWGKGKFLVLFIFNTNTVKRLQDSILNNSLLSYVPLEVWYIPLLLFWSCWLRKEKSISIAFQNTFRPHPKVSRIKIPFVFYFFSEIYLFPFHFHLTLPYTPLLALKSRASIF